MQSSAGRGPGAALGIIAVVIVSIATYVAHRIIERKASERTPDEAIAVGAAA